MFFVFFTKDFDTMLKLGLTHP